MTTETPPNKQTYVGVTSTSFKLRYANHLASFRHISKKQQTELSKHVWSLKDSNTPYDIKWRILKEATPFTNVTNKCQLCSWEKYYIIYKPDVSSLNKRTDFLSCCRHASKFLLQNAVT